MVFAKDGGFFDAGLGAEEVEGGCETEVLRSLHANRRLVV